MMRFTVTKRANHHVSQTAANYTRMHLPVSGTLSIPGLQGGEMLYGVGRPAAPTVSGSGVNLKNLVRISVFWWARTTLSPLKIMNYTPSTCDDDVGTTFPSTNEAEWLCPLVAKAFLQYIILKKSVAEKGKAPLWIPKRPISIGL